MKCPHCGTKLKLELILEANDALSKTSAKGHEIVFRMNGMPYSISDDDIIEAAKNLNWPETIRNYYIELKDKKGVIREYPIKQVVREALQTVRKNVISEDYFTSQRAKQILTKLQFTVKTKT